ncbi:hypothetical protein AAHE18_03G188600 [Arachis hypogaea]
MLEMTPYLNLLVYMAGYSSVRRVALHTGKVEELQRMGDSLFGEGLTLLDKRYYCLE